VRLQDQKDEMTITTGRGGHAILSVVITKAAAVVQIPSYV